MPRSCSPLRGPADSIPRRHARARWSCRAAAAAWRDSDREAELRPYGLPRGKLLRMCRCSRPRRRAPQIVADKRFGCRVASPRIVGRELTREGAALPPRGPFSYVGARHIMRPARYAHWQGLLLPTVMPIHLALSWVTTWL